MKTHIAPLVAALFALAATAVGAEVFQVTRATKSALPGGKEADGMIGDWLIRNDQVVAVIGKTSDWRDANQMVEGVQGAVIDFTPRAANNDELVVFYPMGYRPTGVSANRAEVIRARGSVAEFKVVRDPTAAEPYTSTTVYTLNDGETFLRVRTTHENRSAAPVSVAATDWLRLDNDITSLSPHGDQPVIAMENKWYGAAYGLAALDGRTQRAVKDLDQKTLRAIGTLVYYPAVNPDQKPILTLAPGQSLELNRMLLVARDTAGVQIAAQRGLGRTPTFVQMRAVDATTGHGIDQVFIDVKHGNVIATAALTATDGSFELPLADGRYALTGAKIGRPSVAREIVVSGGKLAGESRLVLEPVTEVTLDIAEAGTGARLPVKVEFRGRNGGPNPNLGPQKRANGAANTFFSARGQDTFPLQPGSYTVHISHGPEYSVVLQDVVVPKGGRVTLAAKLQREIVSPHWIIADLHSHSTGSGDSAAEIPGRVLNLVCSGVEFGLATEHNRISTYTPAIEALGLGAFIASAPGIELSGRPGPGNTNHQIAFPLEIHDDEQGYGAPRTDADPRVQMQRLYDLDNRSPKLMQHNHPDIGWLYFDKNRDGVLDGGYGTRSITDVMEIRETMLVLLAETAPDAHAHTSRAFHWLQMLNQGDRILGTANTDAHPIGPQTGSIFNYVHLDHDDIAHLDPWDVARAIKRGHVVMSNGPFMEVSINGALPGDNTRAAEGKIAVKIRVQQASWSRIDRVQILVNGRQVPAGNFSRDKTPDAFRDGVVQFEREVPLQLPADSHVIVIAAGENETIGRLAGGRFGQANPMAMSNPIFVDVDGGGFHANGDLLGAPLPNGKPRAGERVTDGQ